MVDTFKLLKKLVETPGPSGFEDRIAAVVQEIWEPLVDEFQRDRVGSLIAVKHGSGPEPRPRLLLAAHMDEIGLMVTEIESYPDDDSGNGFLRVDRLGLISVICMTRWWLCMVRRARGLSWLAFWGLCRPPICLRIGAIKLTAMMIWSLMLGCPFPA